ncbi:Uncharacterized protein Ga0061067_102571 [Pannonibacter indicus]|uniref:Secreted protein n=2 Tax=Pannonibacter indicus TaxID=466044 RepID=A0A0K6HT16_9HYPH|nr:Uncharacterized protein Ga0061067_102571 [Pannonibacter indicus]
MGPVRMLISRLAAAVCLAVMALPAAAAARDGKAPAVVVELFTSQGCSSCPPADKLLQNLSKDAGVLALSLPVDYWDYLGWKDTLATPENSERQRLYSARRGDRSVYTPQIIINGGEHVVGGDEPAVKAALGRATKMTASVMLHSTPDMLEVTIDGSLPEGAKMATVYLLHVMPSKTVEVGRGENEGRQVTYVNVVKRLEAVGMWSGGQLELNLPQHPMKKDGKRCAVIVQLEDDSGPGRIIGAASNLWDTGI